MSASHTLLLSLLLINSLPNIHENWSDADKWYDVLEKSYRNKYVMLAVPEIPIVRKQSGLW